MAILDLAGKKFNRLTVKSFAYCKDNVSHWNCVCDCGKEVIVKGYLMKNNNTKSCGCLKADKSREKVKILSVLNKKPSEIIIEKDCAKIKMSNCDDFALIDIEDIPKVKDYCWRRLGKYYPTAKINGKNKYLHRIIMPNDNKDLVTDHINRNPLDNRKCNLRIVNQSVNCTNRSLSSKNKTGYKNIWFSKERNRYIVIFSQNYKKHYVGSYRDLETAVQKLEEYKKEHNL
jgi:hypothetical protein